MIQNAVLTVKDMVSADSGKAYYIEVIKSDPIGMLNYIFQISSKIYNHL